jgi:hypothetical protein
VHKSKHFRGKYMAFTPIQNLIQDLINSVARIAPEKFNMLENFRIKHNPILIFTNEKKFNITADAVKKEIKIPIVSLEYLWCACYAFYIIYQEYASADKSMIKNFDLNGNERTRKALSLYQFGINQLNQNPQTDWPISEFNSQSNVIADEDIRFTNELYLCTSAWIIHHEFAHIYHGHVNKPLNDEESRKQEKVADDSATKWILEGIDDELIRQKRGLGVAIATLVLTAQDILAGEFKETTHPKSFQRLYDTITPHFQEPDHLVYAFSTVILHINMVIAGMKIEKNDNETWRENLETSLVLFSRLKQN